ncbi:hypothetical protein HDU77_004313 [Chytriomyces hyalinus]|nr:hypothetical protein HDU77_004313 [Chytriomyces hyalinus]
MSVHIASGTQDSGGTAHARLYISSEWLRSSTFSSSATTVSVQFDAQDGTSICSTAVSWTPASLVACPAGITSATVPAMCALIACDSTGALGATGAVSAKYSVCAAADSACRNVRYSVVGSVTSGGSGGDDSSAGGNGSGGPASPATTTSSANNPKTSNNGAAPATDSGAGTGGGGGTSPFVYVAIVAVMLVLIGGIVWWYRKRSASKQDYTDSQPSRARSFHYDASADLTPPVSFQSDTRNQQNSRTPKPLPIPGSLSHQQQQNNQTIHPDLSHAAMYNPSALNREIRDMNNNNKPPPPVSKDYELAELKKAEPRFPESRPFQGAASRLAEESAQRTNSIQGSIHSVEPVIEREGAAATVRTVQYTSTPSPETAVIANASPVIDPAAIVSKYRMDDVSSFSGSSAPLPPPPTIQAATNRFDPESSLSQLQSSVNGLPASAASVQGPRQQPQSSRPPRQEHREVPPVGLDALMQTDLPPSYNQQERSQATPVVVAAAETVQQQRSVVQNVVPVAPPSVMTPQGVYASGISGMPQQQPVGGVYANPAFVGNGGYTPSPAAAAYAPYNPYAGYAVPANASAGYPANGNVAYPPMNGNFAMYPPPQQQQQQGPAGYTASPPPQQQGGYPGYYDHLGNYHYYENERRG